MSSPNTSPSRRTFLGALGTAATTAMAAPLVAPTEAQAYDPGRSETRARYQADGADVQAFYRTNGYETLKR